MQGNLSEIDIRSILQLIELGQRTGELFVETHSSHHVSITNEASTTGIASQSSQFSTRQSWFVFFLNGQIVYATHGDSNLSRLHDYLHHYQLETSLDHVTDSSLTAHNALEYAYLWALLERHILTPLQARNIIHGIVHETLFDLLSLHQGSFIFEQAPALAPQLTTLEIHPLLQKIVKQMQEWKQLQPHIQSPHQCLAIADAEQLRQALPATTVNNLERWADGQTSLRQLARYLNRDILTLAKAIYPVVKNDWIQLIYPITSTPITSMGHLQPNLNSKIPRIVCIDDAITICQTVESILQSNGYDAISLSNSLEALSRVFQLKPDLILCDITMPELDGYELCAMLRHSYTFRQTPIVMLTGKDLFIDRVRARMVGATDYLTKPFADSELLMLVEKHLPFNSGNLTQKQCVTTAD